VAWLLAEVAVLTTGPLSLHPFACLLLSYPTEEQANGLTTAN